MTDESGNGVVLNKKKKDKKKHLHRSADLAKTAPGQENASLNGERTNPVPSTATAAAGYRSTGPDDTTATTPSDTNSKKTSGTTATGSLDNAFTSNAAPGPAKERITDLTVLTGLTEGPAESPKAKKHKKHEKKHQDNMARSFIVPPNESAPADSGDHAPRLSPEDGTNAAATVPFPIPSDVTASGSSSNSQSGFTDRLSSFQAQAIRFAQTWWRCC